MSVFKIQPFALDKNKYGDEVNRHCEAVPNDSDFILLLDYDAMILTPKTYQVIENAIAKYPETQIFGAMTNRVGLTFQRLNPLEMDDNDSIRHHIKLAQEQADKYPDGESKSVNQVAGFFMLFRKSYWMKNKFQDRVTNERGNTFDYTFSRPAGKIDGGIKIIKGAYLLHVYRINKNWLDKSHLK